MSENSSSKIDESLPLQEKTFIENINSIIQNYTQQGISKLIPYKDKTVNLIFNNEYVNTPLTIIKQSNNKNLILVKFPNDKNYTITYLDRKITVLSLTTISVFARYFRSGRFKFRWFIPYYAFYSLFICRENLDPYL
jgi:hypothetical protein